MKTERRHELQTNELSQQIDQLGDYIRKNANRLIAIGSVVIVLVVAVAWYVKSKQARVMDGWATLSDATLASDPAAAIDRYRNVASESGNTDLTIAAWLRIGETAMSQLFTVTARTNGRNKPRRPTKKCFSFPALGSQPPRARP